MTSCFIIDENKYELIKTYTWSAKKSGKDKTIYVSTNINNLKKSTILLHRLLLNSREGDEDKVGFMVECKNSIYKLFKGKFDDDQLFKEAVEYVKKDWKEEK
ncbi:2794_t:CDS:2 [Scutellospora calospora]|uniref:2794_t:CDS:1 n=1 Tax=Scutellospora calospora TaxID=85575 RepID=A0ACA9L5H2_9GLOM|nr:2794_t:CDS:2 [Scutellospora calospora]